jgi:hypothetical protein
VNPSRGFSFGLVIWTLAILLLLSLVTYFLYSTESRTLDLLWSPGNSGTGSAIIHQTSALFHAVAMMLLTGIVLVAPVLSLSLHQFHDKVYDLFHATRGIPNSSEFGDGLYSYLCRVQRLYKWPNDLFLAIWFSAVILLILIAITFVFNFGKGPVLLMVSAFFLISAMLLCSTFALLSFVFFASIRPGESKLELYICAMGKAMERPQKDCEA